MDWDDISIIYPDLDDLENVLVPREHDTKELETKSILDIVNEIPGNQTNFQDKTIKDKWILLMLVVF
jgi:hypothetical protein